MNYKDMYYKLFNALTDEIENLKRIQCEAEQMYIENEISDDEEKEMIKNNKHKVI